MKTQAKTRSWLIVAALSLMVIVLNAQPPEPPQGPVTKIKFDQEVYDFGKVYEGTKVTQVYTFTNDGDKPLVLIDAKGSCGCTVPQWPIAPIMPGETASITVEFNSQGKKGMRNQRVTITANTTPPQTFLSLTGEVLVNEDNALETLELTGDKRDTKLSPDCFAIYPNPTAEVLKLEMEESNLGQAAIISIHSKTGQLMAKREIDAIDGTIEFSVGHYPAGTYIANVQIGDRRPEARCFVVVE